MKLPRSIVEQPRRSADRFTRNPLIASTLAFAGSLGMLGAAHGGVVVHDWTGNVSNSWNAAGNWNTNQVPAAFDSVIILGGNGNPLLGADSLNLRSLYVGGGHSLSNNGHMLTVVTDISQTTVNGAGSTLFITPSGDPWSFGTDTLNIQSSGRLQMAGGSALAEQLTLSGNGRIFGHGLVGVFSDAPAAISAVNGSDITVSGGDLTIMINGAGSFAPPPLFNVSSANRTLEIEAPFFSPVNDITLGANSTFASEENWDLGGTLTANPGTGNISHVAGNGSVSVDGDIAVSINGHLRMGTGTNFESTSTTSVGVNSILELDDFYTVDAGHVTTISHTGRLRLDGLMSASGWDGEIVSSGGIIESNNAVGLRIDGSITLGSLLNIRTLITGTTAVRIAGDAVAPGLGAVVDGTLDVTSTGTMELGTASTRIMVNGDLYLRTDSLTFGDGAIQVNDGGELFLQQDATLSVDVINNGDMHAGTSSTQHDVDVVGTYTQGATGRMMFNISGAAAAQKDFYDVHDDATLAGALHVTLVGGYVPAEGQTFEVLSANNVSGTFSAVTGAPGFSVSYTPSSVLLTYDGLGLLGDVNDDGFVNVLDLLEVIIAWGACPPAPAECPADLDDSGNVDVLDLLIVIVNWT